MKLQFIKKEPGVLYYKPILGFFERFWLYLKYIAPIFVSFVIKNKLVVNRPNTMLCGEKTNEQVEAEGKP